jgi:hypothetical protein
LLLIAALSRLAEQHTDLNTSDEPRRPSSIFATNAKMCANYSDGAQDGWPPFDPEIVFKILVIQATNNLSDERTESLINDRLLRSQRRVEMIE